ncbi:MAG: hypothetical protein ACTSRZ_17320 [Promethearchaeota archaeon]
MVKRKLVEKPYVFHNKLLENGGTDLKPKAKGSIPKLAVLLGLLSPFYYDLYKKCDGNTTVQQLAENMNIPIDDMRIYIDKLLKNGLVGLSNG